MPLPSWSKSYSHFVAFFLKAKLLDETIAAKDTSRSQNTVKLKTGAIYKGCPYIRSERGQAKVDKCGQGEGGG